MSPHFGRLRTREPLPIGASRLPALAICTLHCNRPNRYPIAWPARIRTAPIAPITAMQQIKTSFIHMQRLFFGEWHHSTLFCRGKHCHGYGLPGEISHHSEKVLAFTVPVSASVSACRTDPLDGLENLSPWHTCQTLDWTGME